MGKYYFYQGLNVPVYLISANICNVNMGSGFCSYFVKNSISPRHWPAGSISGKCSNPTRSSLAYNEFYVFDWNKIWGLKIY